MKSTHPVISQLLDSLAQKTTSIDNSATYIESNYDSYLLPFRLSNDERKIKTSIATLVKKPSDLTEIRPFPPSQLVQVLHLVPPKRVIQYVPTTEVVIDNKPAKQVRAKGVSRGPRQPKNPKRTQQELASIYAEEASYAAKRSKLNHDEEDEEEDYASEAEDFMLKGGSSALAHRPSKLPANFEQVAGALFEEFWGMEFEDTEVTWAFFAKITALNCKDYKLDNFAESSSSLAVIKDKLRGGAYVSTEDFVYDFHQMFANVFKYYPESHPAHKKAQELRRLFDTRMEAARLQFK